MDQKQSQPDLHEKKINKRFDRKFLWLFVLAIFLLGIAGGSAILNSDRTKNEENKTPEKKSIAEKLLIYGYWEGDKAIVDFYDLSTQEKGRLASLPTNIKHIKTHTPNEILFISETDERDYGKRIVKYNLLTDTGTTLLEAESGFGIDDYVVSSNGNYMAVWEISPPDGTDHILNGRSRVYSLNLSDGSKHLIYDEPISPSIPVNYPIGVTSEGVIFTDRFLANSGAGWAYGMSRTDFTGTTQQELPEFTNGTYGTQPRLTEDEQYLVFAGYSKGDGSTDNNGYRNAIVGPDTIEAYNTVTNKRKILVSAKDGVFYPQVELDKGKKNTSIFLQMSNAAGEVSVSQGSADPGSELVSLHPSLEGLEKLSRLATLSETSILYIQKENSPEFLGNLSGKYDKSVNRVIVLNTKDNSLSVLDVSATPIQLIDIKDSSYLAAQLKEDAVDELSNNQIQLQTFVIKPSIAPVRKTQQSEPVIPKDEVPPSSGYKGCYGYASQMCNRDSLYFGAPPSQECLDWINTPGVCADSPLYLYGTVGEKVSITIGTPVYSPNIPYNPEVEITAVISNDGKYYANGKLISGLSFDYAPAVKKITRPDYGVIVESEMLEKTLISFAKNLKLNDQEINGFLSEISVPSSRYAFVSFFDHETSHKILPLYFEPQPDSYRNIVFYVEEFGHIPQLDIKNPHFEPVKREGLTAVEISILKR